MAGWERAEAKSGSMQNISARLAWLATVFALITGGPLAAVALTPSPATQARPETIVLDASTAGRGFMTSHLTIPAHPGAFTIVYPKWIPGEHGPTGPLNDLTGIKMSADGKALDWRRDTIDLYAFHVTLPAGASTLDVDFTVLLNAPGDTMSTNNLAIVNWNRDILYQADTNSHAVFVRPSIILPPGWGYGTALPSPQRNGDRIDFGTVPLAMLIDSPLDAGRYYAHHILWQRGIAAQTLDLFADAPEDLNLSPAMLASLKRMTPEALALYGARHWNGYHSLLTLSDAIGFQGIEHHQSSDDRADGSFFTDPAEQVSGGDLLTHEFSHSWNGKYRRPYDLWTPNFQVPEQTDLLWVYEGMNQYLGDLLSFRIGIRKPKTYPEYLATVYASMDYEPGRLTTPLIDTTTAAPWLYQSGGDYSSLRRTAGDFYTEGELVWLDVDTIVRQQTHGTKSLDTFLHLYAGPPNTGPITVTYTRADIERLLGDVTSYDWHGLFDRYVYHVSVHPPTDELARSGWKLVYTSKANDYDDARHGVSGWYGIGFDAGPTGAIRDVRRGSAAWNAGLAPHGIVVAIDGRSYSPDTFTNAIKRAQQDHRPISFLVNDSGYFSMVSVDYHGGVRFPHLVRIKGTPDMLAQIMAPRVPVPKKAQRARKT
jgi:predicted metalloprotease with PDZ domain